MDTPGAQLRQRREAKKLSLKQVSKETKISQRYIEALEENNPDLFPGEVYLKGFLRNYAKFLGLDPEDMVSQYEDDGLIDHREEGARSKVDIFTFLQKGRFEWTSRIKGWIGPIKGWPKRVIRRPSFYLILVLLIGFCLVQWFFSYKGNQTPMQQKEGRDLVVGSSFKKGFSLEIEAREDVWLQMVKDKEGAAKEIVLRPGEHLNIEAEEGIMIKVGNAGGILLRLNGRQLPPLGEKGEVVTRYITSRGVEGQR